ncbi:hypothetical protein [Curtobacterium sp. MCBD17_023]|uniref:hypothetical protein n=1 Tax=Curtobacterium sp. MCBD17_023 TaxID=2175657 RepID=UPI000D9512B5|nr:hypothetical protein [Curtobacterium sp. MCBD17_023]PYY46231.1 hypothetical protein DEI84_12950 [Curtobacterium sp. MCBD17_023]
MAQIFTRKPHRVALVGAAAVILLGIALLISPWDGLIVVLAWALIIAGGIASAMTLYFVRVPSR